MSRTRRRRAYRKRRMLRSRAHKTVGVALGVAAVLVMRGRLNHVRARLVGLALAGDREAQGGVDLLAAAIDAMDLQCTRAAKVSP